MIPLQARRGPEGGQRYSSTLTLLRHQNGVNDQQHATGAIYLRERPGPHCIGGFVGPRAGLDGRKISPPPGFDSLPRSQSPYRLSYPGTMHCSLLSIVSSQVYAPNMERILYVVAAINEFLVFEGILITYWLSACDSNRSHMHSMINT